MLLARNTHGSIKAWKCWRCMEYLSFKRSSVDEQQNADNDRCVESAESLIKLQGVLRLKVRRGSPSDSRCMMSSELMRGVARI
jgi:NAD-dependent SIR2 family protein deacetylase